MKPTDPGLVATEVDRVIHARRSIRAFRPEPVDAVLIDDILNAAARAPSGNNIQPWRVHVLTGASRQRLVDATCAAFDAADGSHRAEYHYYPPEFFEPYLARRRQIGWELYGLLGIAKGDSARMQAQHRRNFEFFGAPVGIILTLDRRMWQGSWLDCGMFMQTLMLAAEARGLGTCAQAAWIDYHRVIAEVLDLDPREQVLCAIALGHPDWSAPENSLVSGRAPLDEFVVRHG